MKKLLAHAVVAASLLVTSAAHAALPVTDWLGLVQTTQTALQSLKTEVYENTNIVYQYKMMANQLLQATGLDPAQLDEQLNAIKDDIGKYELYGTSLKELYGSVSENAAYLNRVQSMVVSSGKSNSQWFEDQRALLANGDKTAKNLFSLGTNVFKNTQSLAKRREQILRTVKLTPTAQATAQATTQMLDVLASQNADLLQLMSARTQADADKDQKANAEATEKAEAMRAIVNSQEEQLKQMRARVYSRPLRAE